MKSQHDCLVSPTIRWPTCTYFYLHFCLGDHIGVLHINCVTCHWLAPMVNSRAEGGYVRECKGMEWVLCPWEGGTSRYCVRINEVGWGNVHFCWIMDSNHGDITGIFSAEKNVIRTLWLTKLSHPWGKLSTLLHAFYNPPGGPRDQSLR